MKRPFWHRLAAPLGAALLAHLGGGWLLLGLHAHPAAQPAPTEITVELPSPPPPPPPPKLPEPPRPLPLPVSQPTAKPPPQPAPVLATPTPQPASPVAPAPVVAAPPRPLAPPAPEPVTAPRFDAAYLSNPRPAYPLIARRNGEEGKVLLRVLVSTEGRAQEVQVQTGSGSHALDRAAREAVQNWRFVPAKQGSQAVAAWVLVPIVFKLDD